MNDLITCTGCHELKPASAFRRLSATGRLRRKCRECEQRYQQEHYHVDLRKSRKIGADNQRRRRRDPERHADIIQTQREIYYRNGLERKRKRTERLKREDPFRWKAEKFNSYNKTKITVDELKRLWDCQSGLCALTGIPMDIISAEIDHIIPVSRGGANDLSNLRWLRPEVNQAKFNLTDSEFIAICQQVSEFIARQIRPHRERGF